LTRTPHERPDHIVSPCVDLCQIDVDSELCRGCLRTLTEIAQWTQYSDSERERIMRELEGRSTDSS
jgi:predicted Fe-S protein YdhL (DUF1289 family)